jgi:hypothetical protein
MSGLFLLRPADFAIGQNGRSLIPLQCNMVGFIYRCPTTRRNVQGWFAEEVPANEGEAYETVTCLACQQVHLIN